MEKQSGQSELHTLMVGGLRGEENHCFASCPGLFICSFHPHHRRHSRVGIMVPLGVQDTPSLLSPSDVSENPAVYYDSKPGMRLAEREPAGASVPGVTMVKQPCINTSKGDAAGAMSGARRKWSYSSKTECSQELEWERASV